MLNTMRGSCSAEDLSGYVMQAEERPGEPVIVVWLGQVGTLQIRPAEARDLVALLERLAAEAELGVPVTPRA